MIILCAPQQLCSIVGWIVYKIVIFSCKYVVYFLLLIITIWNSWVYQYHLPYSILYSCIHQIEFIWTIYYYMLQNDSHNVQQEIYFIIAVKTSVYCCLRSIGKSYFHVPLIESLNGLFPRTDIRGHASIEELRINTKKSFPLFENIIL